MVTTGLIALYINLKTFARTLWCVVRKWGCHLLCLWSRYSEISRRQNICNIIAVEFVNPAASLEYNVVFLLVSTSVCSCLVTVPAECLISKAFIYSFH